MKGLLISRIKLLADEDIDARLVKLLLDKGIDIKYASKGIRNSELYSLACNESKALLSCDKDFLNTALFPPSRLPAIIILRVHPPEVSKLEALLLQFLEEFSDGMKGNTFAVTEDGVRIAD